MKKNYLLLFSLFLFLSCSKEDDSNGDDPNVTNVEMLSTTNEDIDKQLIEFIEQALSDSTLSDDDADVVVDALGGLVMYSGDASAIGANTVKITLRYPSVDAAGKPITVSGCIYYNKNATAFNEVVLLTHQTAFNDNQVPSGSGVMVMEPGILTKNTGTVVFASDYIGFNASADRMHPYMNQELAARNEIDMLKAGMEYLKNNPDLPQLKSAAEGLKTYITGYSQGGAVALATHRAIEADNTLCNEMNFKGSYCAAGPHDLETTFEFFKTQKKMTLPIVLPYVLVGMYESYPDDFKGIDLNDYLSDEAKKCDVIGYIRGNDKSDVLSWLQDRGLDTVDKIMSKEALDENSNLWQTLLKCMRRQNLIDGSWTPKHKVVLYHSSGDDIVSYQNSVKARNLWKNIGCTLNTPILRSGHIATYATYILSLSEGKYRVEK